MKFFVISDTHGRLEKVYEVYKDLAGIDAILHLGDCVADALELQKTLSTDVIYVSGNMDGIGNNPAFKILEAECGKIYLSHGHMENVKSNYQNIYYKAVEADCIAAIFGHTHKALSNEVNGIHLINPGSLTFPSDGTRGSFALMETTASGISCSINYYNPQKNKTTPTSVNKVQGGYLRSLLNYSDRF